MAAGQRLRLDAIVRSKFDVSWGKARGWIETGKVWVGGKSITDPGTLTEPDAEIELKMNAPKPRAGASEGARSLSKSEVVFCDTQLVVVNKPAGVSTVPFEKGETGTLEQMVCAYLKQPKVEIVHRLDRETSGLLVLARSMGAAKPIANQFRFHTVQRRYFALVHGEIRSQTIRSAILENRGDGLRGSIRAGMSASRDQAKDAVTHVLAIGSFDGMTLVECKLETGRTHQIRIHLSEAGNPLVGEKAYIREYRGRKIDAPRLMLHAAELGFVHPTRETPMRWVQLPPEDFLGRVPSRLTEIMADRLRPASG